MRSCLAGIALGIVLLGSGFLAAQGLPTTEAHWFTAEDVVGNTGETVTVPLRIHSTVAEVQGWGAAVCHDTAVATLVQASLDFTNDPALVPTLDELLAGFTSFVSFAIANDDSGFTYGVVGDFLGMFTLDPDSTPVIFANPMYEIIGDPGDSTVIEFCDDTLVGVSAAFNQVAVFDPATNEAPPRSPLPNTVHGSITVPGGATPFQRADANGDGRVNISDVVTVAFQIFLQGTPIPCADASDVDDSGNLGIEDPVMLIRYIGGRGQAPAGPFPGCGEDSSQDDLGCDTFEVCP